MTVRALRHEDVIPIRRYFSFLFYLCLFPLFSSKKALKNEFSILFHGIAIVKAFYFLSIFFVLLGRSGYVMFEGTAINDKSL